MKKTTVIEALSFFDEEFDVKLFIEHLLSIERIKKGLNDVGKNRVIDLKNTKQNLLNKW